MSPVFRHGDLRLYLLKLLADSPRHGYDVIRLLQDRFLGIYSPSPGTIYPRLARLEEEGLLTHQVVDGKKVYQITDAGREELRRRLDDLSQLEDEISASVRDITRGLSRDVRQTMRSLREELTLAVREAAADRGRERTADGSGTSGRGSQSAPEGTSARESTSARGGQSGETTSRREDWQDWQDWQNWASWARDLDWTEWPHWRGPHGGCRTGRHHGTGPGHGTGTGHGTGPEPGSGRQDPGGHDHADRDFARDLGNIVTAFVRQVQQATWHAEGLDTTKVANLGRILSETLDRLQREVFTKPAPESGDTDAP